MKQDNPSISEYLFYVPTKANYGLASLLRNRLISPSVSWEESPSATLVSKFASLIESIRLRTCFVVG